MKYLKLAEKYALEYQYDEGLEYYLCAIIVKGGNILSIGYNKRATNGFVEHYADLSRGRRNYCLSTHAEMDCVLKARAKTDLRGSKIYVARIKTSGGVGMAKPCEICQHILFNYGVKRACYTVNDDEYSVMKIVNPATRYKRQD